MRDTLDPLKGMSFWVRAWSVACLRRDPEPVRWLPFYALPDNTSASGRCTSSWWPVSGRLQRAGWHGTGRGRVSRTRTRMSPAR
jgi:hypothetical protein